MPEKYHFCTIMDKNYIFYGLALYDSLRQHASPFCLYVCCMDDAIYAMLQKMQLENMKLVHIREVEDDALLSAKANRSSVEYCLTLKPSWVRYVLNRYQDIHSVIFVDADMFFFSDVKPVFDEWGDGSIFMTEQRYINPNQSSIESDGKYNSGFIGFKHDANALACLQWWRERCIEWCYVWPHEEDRWTDQKYLNQWLQLFDGVKVSQNIGINAAPWNIMNYHTQKKNDHICLNGEKLIAFHFSAVHVFNEHEFNLCSWRAVRQYEIEMIYLPYLKVIKEMIGKVKAIDQHYPYGFKKKYPLKDMQSYYKD